MSRSATADAIVVGGGVVGAAIAHRLAEAGLGRVVLCEQARVAAHGATSRSGGLVRLHHTVHSDTVLTARSLPVFEQWADIVGGDCGYRRTGFLQLVGEQYAGALAVHTAAAASAAGPRRAEVIDPAEAARLYPGLALDGVAAAAFEPDGGYADPVRAATAWAVAARRLGAEVYEGVRVHEVRTTGGGERVDGVESTAGRIAAPLVVLAGGAWGSAPAERLGVHVPVVPRRIGLAQAHLPGAGRPGSPGSVPTCIDDTTGGYFRPDGTDRFFFGVPSHPDVELGRDVAPLSDGELSAALATVARRVPAAAAAPLTGTRAGLDGYTPDKRPVIGPAGPDGLYLALGFSGGGFKMSPAVAELAAVEILDGQAVAGKAEQPLLAPYRLGRFTGGGRGIRPEAPYAHM
ncbi:NAD(P)/FAD-dependent oxidoreductase [Streptomyces montanisoli]|uniref:FAD-binding oxidoreductase n=1 Tax=Streptomyces montanisoli TaxID=2798581 RepID=A0A940RWR3_9ACTN|nr:FAD-dependent oxidoreductase [Streptomyces montanisoli]MBP0460432.1 FAD-binding oxidoreductase [Streptomyces montanisoli]